MKQLNIDGKLINSIEWLYRQTRFTVNGKEVPIGSGVIQGGVLSPALFIIMFNDLISELDDLGFEVFAYADDLAVIIESSE
jgi:retron-type reverse transcriptase